MVGKEEVIRVARRKRDVYLDPSYWRQIQGRFNWGFTVDGETMAILAEVAREDGGNLSVALRKIIREYKKLKKLEEKLLAKIIPE